jgi:hypothetical protein
MSGQLGGGLLFVAGRHLLFTDAKLRFHGEIDKFAL